METLHSIMTVVSPDQRLASLDLKDMYFHVPILSVHQKFLRFHWQGQTYQFHALQFGLSSTPWVFTKELAPVVAFLRTQGIPIFVYLDDILVVGHSPQEVKLAVRTAFHTLIQAGYIINLKKSDPIPVQDLVYIGGRFWTDMALIFLPDPRKDTLISCILSFGRAGSYKPIHQFLHLLGLMAVTLWLCFMPTFG